MGIVEPYVDNEVGYREWLRNHANGFVINTYHSFDPKYMVLHRASCLTISEYQGNATEGGFTEHEYAKVCGDSIDDLKAWMRRHGRPDGSFSSTKCGVCQPLSRDTDDWD